MACIGAGEQLPALLQVLRRHRQGHTFTLAALSYDIGHEREHAREHAIPHGCCVNEAALAQAVGQDAAAWAGQLAATALPAPPQDGSEAQPAPCAPEPLPQAAPAAGELLRAILSPPPSAAAAEELPSACGEVCRETLPPAVLQALSAGADQGRPPAAAGPMLSPAPCSHGCVRRREPCTAVWSSAAAAVRSMPCSSTMPGRRLGHDPRGAAGA